MKNILITGGFGYIGSRFLEKYRNEFNFHVIDNLFFDGIAASIAGDNVVLIISYGNKEALRISKLIDSYLN